MKTFTPIPPRDAKTTRIRQLQDALYTIAETDGLDAVPSALQRAFVDMAHPSAVHQKSLMATVRAILVPGYSLQRKRRADTIAHFAKAERRTRRRARADLRADRRCRMTLPVTMTASGTLGR